MSELSGNNDKSRAIAEVPEYILRAITRMGEPSVQAIERILPAQHKKLAADIHSRLMGNRGRPDAGATPDAIAAEPVPASAAAPQPLPGFGARPSGPGREEASSWAVDEQSAAATSAGRHSAEAQQPPASSQPQMTAPTAAESAESEQPVQSAPKVNPLVAAFDGVKNGGFGGGSVMDPGDRLDLDNSYFEQYESGSESETGAKGIKVRHRGTGDEAKIEVTWERPDWAAEDDIVVYRVTASDRVETRSPETADLVLCTVGLGFEEPEPRGVAFRHFQVWANTGADQREVLNSQPRLIGEDICVLPVPGVDITVSAGVVEGKWDVVEGYSEIRVFASPASSMDPVDSPANQLYEGVSGKGFEHKSKIRGDRMRYAITPAVEFRGIKEVCTRSDIHEIFIKADLEKVELESWSRVNVQGDERIHIAWYSPAAGQVKVFLSPRAPSPGLSFQAVPVEALDRDDALAEGREVADEQRSDGEQVDIQPMWPSEWDEVHITPVTVVDDMAVVGDTKVLQRVRPIKHAALMERTDSQLITFEWPAGASMVKIETAPTGTTAVEDRTFHADYDETLYRRNGGVRLNLNPFGENVLLTPRSIYAGKETSAEPTELVYRGLRQYKYSLRLVPEGLLLRLWCEGVDDRNPPRFKVVHHPTRFPLSLEDAAEPGAGECRPRQVIPAQTLTLGEPSREIRPTQLPDSAENSDRSMWLIGSDELSTMRPGQWFRLFIVDSGLPGHVHDPDGPRRIVTDERNELPYVAPNNWNSR